MIVVPSAIFRNLPIPNAAKLLESFLLGAEGQSILVDSFALRSVHGLVTEKPGRTPFSSIKLMTADPALLEAQAEEIRARYAKILWV